MRFFLTPSKESTPIEPSLPIPRVVSSSEAVEGYDIAGISTRDRLFKWILQLGLSRSFAKTEVWSSGNIAKDVSSRCRLVSHDAILGFFLSRS